jgi:hypothetical protein
MKTPGIADSQFLVKLLKVGKTEGQRRVQGFNFLSTPFLPGNVLSILNGLSLLIPLINLGLDR